MQFLKIMSVWQNWFDFKPDTIIINHQLEFSGTRVKYLDHIMRKGHTNMRFGLMHSEKTFNNRSFWRVQRD